jgi:hypothetical protein
MARFTSKLNNVRVAAPCPADWDSMYGNERVRFCEQCQLNVYNLSEMSRVEAEQLIGRADGRLCVRYYRRRDGSILTQNCPVGLRKLKRRFSRVATAIGSSVLSFVAGVGFYQITAPRYITGSMVMGDVYQPLRPSVTGELAHQPSSPKNEVLGRLVPVKISRGPVQKLRKLR